MPETEKNSWSKYPLPPGWEIHNDEKSHRKYFINHVEKRTTWDDPRPAYYSCEHAKSTESNSAENFWSKYPLPPDWEAVFDEKSNRNYYVNHSKKLTTWDDPRANLYANEYAKSLKQRTSVSAESKLSDASICSSNSASSQNHHTATFEELAHLSRNPSSSMPEYSTELPDKTPSSKSTKSRSLRMQPSSAKPSERLDRHSRVSSSRSEAPTRFSASPRVETKSVTPHAMNAASEIENRSAISLNRHRSSEKSRKEMNNTNEPMTPLIESNENQLKESDKKAQTSDAFELSSKSMKKDVACKKLRQTSARGPDPSLRISRLIPKGPDANLCRGSNVDLRKGSDPCLRKGTNPNLLLAGNGFNFALEIKSV